jgi:hypothetical protein
MFIAGALAVLLFIGGGIVTPFNNYAAIALYISSPLPLIVYKVVGRQPDPPQSHPEPPKEPPPEDPVAPTLDEPSAV